ncbi:hypothetical protein PSC78_08275 [Enterococcus faecalis]|nr:hypothetical protein [Enterococcus faecalis]WDA14472.1 hypothetical protein PSC78_08275 [Enterococcus faecalis]
MREEQTKALKRIVHLIQEKYKKFLRAFQQQSNDWTSQLGGIRPLFCARVMLSADLFGGVCYPVSASRQYPLPLFV